MKLNHDFSKVINTPLFKELQKTVNDTKIEAYVIGGFVRDHLLNRPNKKDIDIVALGSGIDLAIAVQKNLKGAKRVQIFKTYGTALVQWNELDLEFVGARKESYSKESRNPAVEPGSLEDDQKKA